MPKTSKTAKTIKSKKRGRRVAQVERALDRTQTTIEMVKDVATRGLRFGLGLGAYLLDSPENLSLESLRKNLRGDLRKNLGSFVETAINKGQKIEKEQLDRLMSFEQEQRKRVKEFLQARRKELKQTEASLEDKIEEVIASLDIPTRQDIHQLNRRMNELSKELSRQRTTGKGSKRSKQSETATQNA
jgi:polyhydroxyalkanoate synthesis regulator phasin